MSLALNANLCDMFYSVVIPYEFHFRYILNSSILLIKRLSYLLIFSILNFLKSYVLIILRSSYACFC